MRTAIYGAGSLGTVMGAYLTREGVPVDLINRMGGNVLSVEEIVTRTKEMLGGDCK